MTYTSERTPILGGNSPHASNSNASKKSWISRVVHFFGGGIFTPTASTYDPIEVLLNTKDADERDRLTQRWKDNKVSELNFVGIVAALLAGVLTSTGSWPHILPDGAEKPWPVRTSWYCGIILSLFSILTAADQTIRLHRLSSHRDAWKNIRNLLVKSRGKVRRSKETGRILPSMGQIYTLQLPVMFLTTATISMIVGMFLHVWSAAARSVGLDSNAKMAMTFTIVAVVSIALFFAGQVALYTPDNEEEE